MPDIQHAIVIDAPVERILPLVSSADGFSRWWAEDVTADASTKAVDLGFFNRTTTYRLTPEADRDATRWRCTTGQEWAGTTLTFRLVPQGKQTRLEFGHEGWAERTPYFVSCTTMWGHLMFLLKDAAERGGAHPYFTRSGTAGAATGSY
jgi:hypothetical protein